MYNTPLVKILTSFCTSHFQNHLALRGKLPKAKAKRSYTILYHQMVQLREMPHFTVDFPASVHKFVIKIGRSKKGFDVISLKCASCLCCFIL